MLTIIPMEMAVSAIPTAQRGSDEELKLLANDILVRGLKRLPIITIDITGIVCLHGHRRIEAVKSLGNLDTIKVILVVGDLNELPDELSH